MTPDAVDLFAGPGGWDVAARDLGLDVIGVELDKWACETRRAAGLATIEADVRTLDPCDFDQDGLILSPPCQSFSNAGLGAGRAAMGDVLAGVHALTAGEPMPHFDDERTALVLEGLRWILARHHAGRPFEWIAAEQVPPVLPVWEQYAVVLRGLGYRVAVGLLSAEQYGVPQTRKRAILVARLHGPIALPTPTHEKYRKGTPRDQVGLGLLPWVSMADALGEGMTSRPSMTVTGGGTATGGAEVFGHGAREGMKREAWGMTERPMTTMTFSGSTNPIGGSGALAAIRDEQARGKWIVRSSMGGPKADGVNGTHEFDPENRPAHVVTTKTGEWVPDFNDQSGTPVDSTWPRQRPSTTVAGREIVQNPGATANRFNGSTKSRNDGVRVTPQEAAILQTFPSDYPWAGKQGKVFEQIGNAIPPLLALAILRTVAQGSETS